VSEGSWRVELALAAQRQLRKLPPDATARARGPILALALARDPRPPGAVRLAGGPFWRLRIGDLRVVYAIGEAARTVVVVRVARRSESTYRRVR
jgi:mRNA-degrading endonuclease RelE of RelBE toxin-antitoxin system